MSHLTFPNITPSYERLLDAIQKRSRPIVAWIGAGLSSPAGLPSWNKLRDDLQNELATNAAQAPGPKKSELEGRLSEIVKQTDPWKAFGLLQGALGESTFRSSIREKLAPALKVQVPELYKLLWTLPVDGMINLNIDRLAQRALTEVRSGEFFNERHGRAVTALLGRITQDRFIANLHGQFEDPATWVFTEHERTELLKDERYHEFVRDCAKYCTIVMMGVSADDAAVLDHFRRAAIDGLPLDTHYWLTDRADIPAEVERYGISVLHYSNPDRNHRALVQFVHDAAKGAVSVASPPVVPLVSDAVTALVSPSEIVALTPNAIRKALNSAAAEILASSTDDAYRSFDEFCRKYARAILNAGYVSNDRSEQADQILDYRITGAAEDREGAFGKVWRAVDSAGVETALKIFRYEVREKPGLLRAFRRGIRSLRILSQHKLPGIVEFKAASEIPPVLAMEWVNGANLHDAILTGLLRDWLPRLRVARDLSRIVFSAHNLPERVLHRDIRPPNIMLRDFYADPEEAEVVVLDFDLSWHVGALEQSVHAGSGSAYLAPEQLNPVKGATSRSAAVDSFGFGMTLFYILTGQEPGSAFHPDWKDTIRNAIAGQKCKGWRSLPFRVARLIESCTNVDQHRRPIFSQIVYELETMYGALISPEAISDMDFLAEEALARTPEMVGYMTMEGGGFYRSSPSGLLVELGAANAATSALTLKISFQQTGTERFQNLGAIGDYFKKILARLVTDELAPKSASRSLLNSPGNHLLQVDVYLDDHDDFVKFCKAFGESMHHLSTLVARS